MDLGGLLFIRSPNLPESLVEGKERTNISHRSMKGLAYNPSAITEEDIDVW